MLQFSNRELSITLDVPLARQAFDLSKIHAFSEVVFESMSAEKFSLPTSAVTLTTTDVLYRYSSDYNLFEGVGKIGLTSSALSFEFKNLSTVNELAVVSRIATKTCEALADRISESGQLMILCHSDCSNPEEGEAFFRRLAPAGYDHGAIRVMTLANKNPESLRRLTIEKSYASFGGAFVAAEITNLEKVGDFAHSWIRLQNALKQFDLDISLRTNDVT